MTTNPLEYDPALLDNRRLADENAELRSVATELLRLYDWRKERGGAITDSEARQYGREKAAAWDRLRGILNG